MKKYILIFALVILTVLFIYLIWGWSTRANAAGDQCAMANAKAELFQKAINEFGALTPEEAAQLWGKGVQERNGALQYSVMSAELKQAYKEHLDKNYPAWVTGFSSPWVESFQIIEAKKISNGVYEVLMQFSLATSAGSEGKHLAKVAIINEGQYWGVKNVAADEEIMALAALDFMK